MKTLVVGATGLLGREICQRLATAGQQVRALIRPTADPGKRAALVALGVELVEGDLKDAGSLARATNEHPTLSLPDDLGARLHHGAACCSQTLAMAAASVR